MKNINKITKVVAKILEIAHWIAVGFMTAIAICIPIAPQLLGKLVDIDSVDGMTSFSVYGFEVRLLDGTGTVNRTAFCLFAICAAILCALVAMIFRNIRLIIKKAEETSPFDHDNIRKMREIGIYSMSMPIVGLIMDIITSIIIGWTNVEIVVNLDGFVMGIIVLSLTQFFAYGAELENDTEGLL